MTAEQLMLYFNLALGVLIVLGALRGFAQGFKKSLFKLVKEGVYWIIFFLTADLVTNALLNSQLVFSLVLQYFPLANSNPTNLIEFVQCFLVEQNLINEGSTLVTSINFAFSLVSIVLKIAYLVVYLIVGRFIYWIICGIIWKFIIHKKKKDVKFEDKKLKNGKVKKVKKVTVRKRMDGPRLFGLLFGGLRSLIGTTLIVSIIMGVASFIPKSLTNDVLEGTSKVEATNKIELSAEQKNSIATELQGLEEYIKFVDDIENSPFVKLVRLVKSDETSLDMVLFDTVMNGNYAECNIKTRESLSLLISMGYDAISIMEECQDDEGNIDINKADFNKLASIVEKLSQVDLIIEALPAVLEIGLSMKDLPIPVPVDDELRQAVAQIDWQNDFVVLASMVKSFAEIEDLNAVLDEPSKMISRANEGFICGIIENLSNLTFVTGLIPKAIEIAFESEEVKELIKDATVDLSNIVWKDELVDISGIYSTFQLLSKDISNLLFVQELTPEETLEGINLNALNQMILKIFELGLVQELFEPLMTVVISNIEDESIREMLDFDFSSPSEWAKEFTILIDIVKDLVQGDDPFAGSLDISLLKYVKPETIEGSKILSKVMISALVDSAKGEGVFAGEGAEGLSSVLEIPSDLQDKENSKWLSTYEDGVLVKKGELYKTIEALQALLVNDETPYLLVGDRLDLDYQVKGTETEQMVTWVSLKPSVASVNFQTGEVEALAPGHAVIAVKCMSSNLTAFYDVVVRSESISEVTDVYIEGNIAHEITIGLGKENREYLTANTNLDATNQEIRWESLNENVVVVNQNGAIEGVSAGKAIVVAISVSDSTKKAICEVTVAENIIEVNKNSIFGYKDKVVYLDATINGQKEDLTYSVLDERIATVDSEGFVTLLEVGSTEITVSSQEKNVSKTIFVIVVPDDTPTAIKIIKAGEGSMDVNSILNSLNDEDISIILDSEILARSLSKILIESLETGDSAVHISKTVIGDDNGAKYIVKEELKSILTIFARTSLGDALNGIDPMEVVESLSDEDVDLICESKVISSFLTEMIVNTEGLIVPMSAYQDSYNDYCYMHTTQEIKYLKPNEIKSLIKAIRDYDLIEGNIELKEDNSELSSVINASYILRATVGDMIISLDSDGTLVIPDQAIEKENDIKMLEEVELNAFLDGLYALGIRDLNDLNLDLSIQDLKNATNDINESYILRATISDMIVSTDDLIVPADALSQDVTKDNQIIDVLTKKELGALFNGLLTLGINELDSISVNPDFVYELDDEIKDSNGNTELTRTTIELEKSKIIMATLPENLDAGIQNGFSNPVNVTFEGVVLEGTLNEQETAYVENGEGELVKLFRGMQAADILTAYNSNHLTGKITDENSNTYFINKKLLIVNQSKVLKPTVSDILNDLTGDNHVGNYEDDEISLILSKGAAEKDFVKAVSSCGKSVSSSFIRTHTTNIENATTIAEVENTYDAAIAAIDAL